MDSNFISITEIDKIRKKNEGFTNIINNIKYSETRFVLSNTYV